MEDDDPLERLRAVLAVERPHLVVPRRIDARGERGPTEHAARSRWRRCYAGLFVPADVQPVPEQRVVEAAAVVAGRPAAIGGWASLCWRGARWFNGTGRSVREPVPVTISTFDRRPQPGLALSGESLPPQEVETLDGVTVLTAVRAVGDVVRRADGPQSAFRAACMAAYDDLVSATELQEHARACGPRTGVGQLRAAAVSMDENCWSPREADTLWEWRSFTDLPPLLANVPVFRNGRHVGTPDLLEPTAGLAIQYDGMVHLDALRRRGDLRREHDYRSAGLEVVTLVAGMTRRERLRMLEEAHARAVGRRHEERRWTIDPPERWVVTTSVDARRRLSELQRDRLLRYRQAA